MTYLEQGLIAYKKGDYHTAKKIFTRLATLNRNADAHYLLGMMQSSGQGFEPDPTAAANYYHTAATAGHPQAAYDLAALYALGRGVEQDYTTALSWYRRAAEAGILEAMFVMGTMYANGEGVRQDFETAQKWWLKAAAQNHAIASFYIGHLYNNGDGRERNPATAANWYLKAWDAGHDQAEIYLNNLLPTLEELGRGGAAEAQAVLGAIYYTMYGNYPQAINWLQLATAQEHPEATRLLGYCYEQGEGVEQDTAQAVDLYHRAAQLGDQFAQFNLATYYATGYSNVERDLDTAIHWYRQAAEQGLFAAQHPLAELLAARNRDRADAKEAIHRLRLVAQNNSEAAEYQLTAGDGKWTVTIAQNGVVVSLVGMELSELEIG
ncbi:hypothetical protein CLI64_08255 [Nostoc sp. CENA543]|uniref:tetratricopeptide repeat protein n=1 Tax=Nostoc sp. CENA543 TaxID=1869241 RepID=UPI000CA38C9D|nr:tetratricopeptide repeat protein [Nostoc sp. CENA543]AUT00380.1 hypothetical protein CLI64_08255 [Nostoc sp. CENA543]